MKAGGLRCFLVLFFLCAPNFASAQLYQWSYITPDEAIEQIRQFEGAPELEVTVVSGPGSTDPEDAWYGLYRYELTTADHEYTLSDGRINRSNSLFREWEVFYGGESDDVLATMMLPESEMESIALGFMNAHFPQPSVLSLPPKITYGRQSAGSRFDDHEQSDFSIPAYNIFSRECTFSFSHHLPNDILGPSSCSVGFDTVYGKVIRYRSTYFPVLVDTQPTLTPEQAAASAVQAMRMKDATMRKESKLGVTGPGPWGLQRLVYSLDVCAVPPLDGRDWPRFYVYPTGMKPEHIGRQGILDILAGIFGRLVQKPYANWFSIMVDAHDGSVLFWGQIMGFWDPSTEKPVPQSARQHHPYMALELDEVLLQLASPPIRIGRHAYLDARYLCYGDPDAELISADEKTYLLTREGREFTFTVDSKEYSADGETRRLPAPAKMVNGRFFVPIRALEETFGWGVAYDSHTVRLFTDGEVDDRKLFHWSLGIALILMGASVAWWRRRMSSRFGTGMPASPVC